MPTVENLLTYIYVQKNLNIGRLLCNKWITVCVRTPNHLQVCSYPAQSDFKCSLLLNQASGI